jgi:hypothetical protein
MAVIERSGSYHCGACGGLRERLADTHCVSDAELLQALEWRSTRRPHLLAFACALPCFLASILARGVPLELRWLMAIGGVFVFLWQLARDQHQQRYVERRRTFEIEQRIIGLAFQNDGVLREQEVSERLRISLAETRSVLQELARQDRAIAYGQGGRVAEFRFGEARRTRAIRARRASQERDSVEASPGTREGEAEQKPAPARNEDQSS